MAAELLQADGRTDVTKLIVAFSYFANATKMSCILNLQLFSVAVPIV